MLKNRLLTATIVATAGMHARAAHRARPAIGGAPIYGSDAIAGTIKVILKEGLHGPRTASDQQSIIEYGDNHRVNLSGAYGVDFAGGGDNLTLAASYGEVHHGVVTNARSKLRDVGNQLNPTAAQVAA